MKNVYHISSNCITPLGFTTEETYEAVLKEKSELKPHMFDFSETPFLVSLVDDKRIDASFSNIGNEKAYTKLEKMSILSIADTISNTSINLIGEDTLLIYCTTKGNIDLLSEHTNGEKFDERIYLHTLAQRVCDFFNLANKPLVVSNACISSLQGILVARRLLIAGIYKKIIVVGGDIVSKFTLSGFNAFNALSGSMCKPFDAERNGINLGEAAASMLLTTENFDCEDNVEVKWGSSSNDAHHISAPSRTGEGLFQAISTTIARAEIPIDFISAHGTATIYNDEMEAHAFYRAGINELPLHSLKGYFGHTLGASGIIESILGIQSLLKNQAIASKGYNKEGTTYSVAPILKHQKRYLQQFLKTSSGFGGGNAAVLFSKSV